MVKKSIIKKRGKNNLTCSFFIDSNGITHDFTEQEAHDTLQGENYNYGYGYGGGYTSTADNNEANAAKTTTPFGQGMQSPFRNNVQQVASPFGVGNSVHSPFNHANNYAPAETTDTVERYASYQPETPAVTSYEPDAYAPESQTDVQTTVVDDDEDDLGFGNTKVKAVKTTQDDDDTTAEKPNEVVKEEKTETKAGGWGLFSLFGRKEKGPAAEQVKPIKANLGKESSFYYDEKEKRWVNKNVSLKYTCKVFYFTNTCNFRLIQRLRQQLHHLHLKRQPHLSLLWSHLL